MVLPTDINELLAYINGRYRFQASEYPELGRGVDTFSFALRHSILHMNKSLGKLAAEAERVDHGGQPNQELLEIATTKMLVNVLKLAGELGMTGEKLARRIPEIMKR